MATPAFLNRIYIGAPANGSYHFQTDDDDGGVNPPVNQLLTQGWYTWDTLRTAMLTLIQTDIPTARMGLSSTGHWTFDKTGGGTNFSITFADTWLARLFGCVVSPLTGAQSYTLSRRARGMWMPSVPVAEFRQEPAGDGEDVRSNAGVLTTNVTGDEVVQSKIVMRHIDNVTEYTSPAGSYGTTYVGTGITEYYHAREFWWRLEDGVYANQGWRDGRYFDYFADAANAAIPITSALGYTYSSSNYTRWQAKGGEKQDWAKIAQPIFNYLAFFDLTIPVQAYVSPT